MTIRRYSVPFGQGDLPFTVPRGWAVEGAAVRPPARGSRPVVRSVVADFPARVRAASRAVIVFTDITRPSPDRLLAIDALRDLLQAGMPPDKISFMCAVGMHRPSTREEKIAKLGEDITARFPVIDHDPRSVVTHSLVGDIPVEVNHLLVQPGTLVVALGIVEPHQYAGYSGGAKTVVMGCGGARTIAATHGPRLLQHESTRLGRINGNPFQAFVREAGQRIGVERVYNAVLDETHDPVVRMAGPPDRVHDTLVMLARQRCEAAVNAPFDIVVAGVGAPKDANLYQASRAATYIGLSSHQVLRPGGVIILPVPIPEGAGQGEGERNFITALSRSRDLGRMLRGMESEGCLPGEQRAYMVGQMLRHYRVIVVGAQDPTVVKQAHFAPVDTMDEAFALAEVWCGAVDVPPRVLIVPNALHTLPVPRH